ncbi:hypothetical protein [Lentisalinibacter sediminis]|uniref:hypothetical protein n=1 Tax=Lentisalinibacter sediminis TaxID=2992237 RepID=UPI0038636BBB
MAEYHGQPHIYDCPFDESLDDYPDHYFVAPIDFELLQLILQDWEIWRRWESAYKAGTTDSASHPALPEDAEEHERLRRAIGDRFFAKGKHSKKLWARFRTRSGSPGGTEVQWYETEEHYNSNFV